jgi:hypothetical protein
MTDVLHPAAKQIVPADWVVCLEVMEHIPKASERTALALLRSASARGMVISWATPGQGGHGHVNEQSAESVRSKFEALGFAYDASATKSLRGMATLPWFRKTSYVFRKVTGGLR